MWSVGVNVLTHLGSWSGQGASREREVPHTYPYLYSLMCQGLKDTVLELDGPAIATCLWALGRLGQAPPGAVHVLLEELLEGSAAKMQHCSFPQLADVAWSMAKLQVRELREGRCPGERRRQQSTPRHSTKCFHTQTYEPLFIQSYSTQIHKYMYAPHSFKGDIRRRDWGCDLPS